MKIYKTENGYIAIYKKSDNNHYTMQGYTRLEIIKKVLSELSLYQTGFLTI
jgi:hypothetical protein